jgi:toxin HigB-1
MIRSFRHKGLRDFFERDDGKKLPPDLLLRIQAILTVMNQAGRVDDLNLATFKLHPLKGELKGFWAITVRANWRIIFRFSEGDFLELDFLDYH